MFQGKKKALSFSFDDGVTQDRRLVAMLNRYGLKATFHLNSGLLGTEGGLVVDGVRVRHDKVRPDEVGTLYMGHEVAAHTLTHPNLTALPDDEAVGEVEEDRRALSRLVGYEVVGFSYPCGGVNHDARVEALVEKRTGVRYARTTASTYSFDRPAAPYRFDPTLPYRELHRLFALGRSFLALAPEAPQAFLVWGHSYELDAHDTWEAFESFCRLVSGRDDIFYGTYREVLLGE